MAMSTRAQFGAGHSEIIRCVGKRRSIASGGRARVPYLPPGGMIEFTR